MALIFAVIAIPVSLNAQDEGAFVGSLGLGISSAQGEFSDSDFLAAGSGFGFGAEFRYYNLDGYAVGLFINYNRFGSSYSTSEGRPSFNFSQLGALWRMDLGTVSNGRVYFSWGGGVFTPNAHFYVPDFSVDRPSEKMGGFGFAGFGLSSATDRLIIYELEFKYNLCYAEYILDDIEYNDFNFIYMGIKLSYASKGKKAPPRY
jgi:hypothetical protein